MKQRRPQQPLRFPPARLAEVRGRVLGLLEGLPEARAATQGSHLSLEVRGKRFGWLLADHHGDGRLALHCKASEATRAELARRMPGHVHVPRYVGHHGWAGLWLDQPRISWPAVGAALAGAYRLAAPRRLLDELDP